MFLEYLRAFRSNWVTLLSGGLSVLLSLIAAIADWKSVPTWMFWIAAASAFLLSSYKVWEQDHHRLQQLLERKLVILFEDAQPTYFQEQPGVPLLRVCVWNTGNRTIDDVGLEVIRMEPCDFEFLPVPLQAMHNLKGPLHPDGKRFFDVVQQFPNGLLQLVHSVPGAPSSLRSREYQLTLQAYGRDALAVVRTFTLKADDSRPRLMPEARI